MNKWLLLLALPAVLSHAEEFSFDLSAYRKPAWELSGYGEASAVHSQLDRDSAFYRLQFTGNDSIDDIDQYAAAVQLAGLYRFSHGQLSARLLAETQDNSVFGNSHQTTVQELYYQDHHFDRLSLELGKRVQKWGKGYAWNPVAFIERKKDPNDPEQSREGFVMASADYVRSYGGTVKTLAFMPVILPVTDHLNDDYSELQDTNLAARLYVLYRDMDIDFMVLAKGSRSARAGFDFSANISSNMEIHGEWARIFNETVITLDSSNQLVRQQRDLVQSLLGIRYLSEQDITWIGEYYHNGAGYDEHQLEQFFMLAKSDPVSSPALVELARQLPPASAGNSNPGQDYLYISATRKEPFDLLYFNIGLNSIINLQDASYSITPEFLYTGYNNTEMRLRLVFLQGSSNSEFGEKLNQQKIEFRFRYYY